MGKRHRLLKRLKSEKAKTKFKGKLPKGTNVTNAEFKVKQIIVPSQSTFTTDSYDGKRNINLKEVLKKMKHHNEKIRINSCEDLTYFITNNKGSILDLYLVIQSVSEYIQDHISKARRAGLNTINTLLHSFTERDIEPHFHYFSVNLRCAMTHIDKNIREDSLLFLDAFIINCPKLIAKCSNELLPNFLLLISDVRNQTSSERSLSINLKSSVTSTQWRISVLSRLYSILEGAISYRKSSKKKEWHQYSTINGSTTHHFPLLKTWTAFLKPCESSPQQKSESETDMQLLSIFPLLLGIWLEKAQVKSTVQDSKYLSEEGAMLLNCITKIVYLILQLLEQEKRVMKSAAPLINCLVQNVPYRLRDGTPQINKCKNKLLKSFHTIDVNCFQQNSIICYFYLLLYSDNPDTHRSSNHRNIVNVIEDFCCKNDINANVDVTFLIKILELKLIDQPLACKANHAIICDILKGAICLHKRQLPHRELDFGLLKILADVGNTQLSGNEDYIGWLQYLPRRFLLQTIHESDIRILLNLSSRGLKPFNQAYMKLLREISENLDDLKVVDTSTPQNSKLKILDILFYACQNDGNIGNLLRNVLGENSTYWPRILEIFSMKHYIKSQE